MDELYQDIECSKCGQRYGDHLTTCPICLGETMGPATLETPRDVVFPIPKGANHDAWAEAKRKYGKSPRPDWFPKTVLRNNSIMY